MCRGRVRFWEHARLEDTPLIWKCFLNVSRRCQILGTRTPFRWHMVLKTLTRWKSFNCLFLFSEDVSESGRGHGFRWVPASSCSRRDWGIVCWVSARVRIRFRLFRDRSPRRGEVCWRWRVRRWWCRRRSRCRSCARRTRMRNEVRLG